MPDDVFRQHFRLRKETVRWLCDEVAEELGGVRSTALSVERQVLCALRFFATGSFQGSVGSEETIGVTQPAVSKCVRRVAEAIVHAGTRNKWVHFPRTSEEKAAVKEGFLRRGGIPGVIGCVDGSLIAIIAPKGDNKAAYMCRKGFYALNSMFICDAGMRILAVDALRPGSDHDAHIWRTTWLRRRFQEGHIAKAGEHLLVPRVRAARIMYLKGCAARDNVITLFGTTRQQHQHYLRRVRRRLRRQQHRQQQ
ncbi:hypothetical protein HPB49_019198 [Dermacentor silvarum]|uniref:Uncharacterized protein n=1 Tax=Dermacentor silvarum TaxID=543639 RepID=A0ACB8CSS3_DERSI|nr:hypothetical protein HPB49_019198 [Dermacentor silvarum]